MTDSFVGRAAPLRRLGDALDEAMGGTLGIIFVSGEAGIGKTSLLARAAEMAKERGATVAWGTCWDSPSAPAFWPWVQVLRDILTAGPDEPGFTGDRDTLARLVPELAMPGAPPPPDADDEGARFRLLDAIASLLERRARRQPLVVVLDDLQWADRSSLELLDFVARPHRPVRLLLLGAYRHDELRGDMAPLMGKLVSRADAIRLHGLSADDVWLLVSGAAGEPAATRWAENVHRRSGGHPLFVRELAHLVSSSSEEEPVPAAVRDAVLARLAGLSPPCVRLLEIASLAGNTFASDLNADAAGLTAEETGTLAEEAVRAGVLLRDREGQIRFAHDLFREAIADSLTASERAALHHRLGTAMVRRSERGASVIAGDVARHLAAAVSIDGPELALRWAMAAAAADRSRLAFVEAAAHLTRARKALTAAGVVAPAGAMADVLVAEADALARGGETAPARALLGEARALAVRLDDPDRIAGVALGVQRLGARFAMPRDHTIAVLEEACAAMAGREPRLEAQLTASLARELNHSVPTQRARAGALSEQALRTARELDEPVTLAACLLARHDVLWTPGRAAERVAVAREIASVAERAGDQERHCEGLLLTANALLEEGSPAFRPVLNRYLDGAQRLGQPRDGYFVLTRRAALALLDGRVIEGDALLLEAASLGERIGEPDTGNVRMSQLLEVARATADPVRLCATAEEAIRWWVGVPSHAHAVAAGFYARAHELDAARRCLNTVLDLDEWRDDHSYLRPVFLGGLAAAAAALRDLPLCRELFSELSHIADSCAVNGAVVCFMGANAHWAGVLAATLGRQEDARSLLARALTIHERLGARAWEAETCAELALFHGVGKAADTYRRRAEQIAQALGLDGVTLHLATLGVDGSGAATLSCDGDVWEVCFRGRSARLRDAKGLHDLALLLVQPGVEVQVLQLAGVRGVPERTTGTVLDRRAREEYRLRLAELDEELERSERDHDIGRKASVEAEREALVDELRRATGLGGRDRGLGGDTVERARKAVTARLRDVIGRIDSVLPELGQHLKLSIRTGASCSYQPQEPLIWKVAYPAGPE
ncbi:MAG: AAA family ATPase [Candidatus Dormibacteria bacterium]